MNRSSLGRVVVGVVLFLALGGPSPGAVGACDGDISTVDADQFCANRKARECNRGRARGELPAAPAPCTDDPVTPVNESEVQVCAWQYCLGRVPSDCTGQTWDRCATPPSVATANACLSALENPDRVGEPTNAIPECSVDVICPAAGALREGLEEEPFETDLESAPSDSAEVP